MKMSIAGLMWILFSLQWNNQLFTVAQQEICIQKADLVFVLDSSGSIRDKNPYDRSYDNWNLMLDFVVSSINGLDIGPDSTHVGLISFSETAYHSFFLGDYTDKNSLIDMVRGTYYLGSDTNTAEAIRKMHTEQFGGNRDRPDAQNIAIIITDGTSTINNQSTIPEAQRAHNMNIIIYAIGITDDINVLEIQRLSSPPQKYGENFFISNDFQTLQRIAIKTCEEERSLSCPPLTSPFNGVVEYDEILAIYVCNQGYILLGESQRICQDNGQWSGTAPVCNAASCSVLRAPVNGWVQVDGGIARYGCDEFYTLQGDGTRTCLTNGIWSGRDPLCNRAVCPALQEPRNGWVVVDGGMAWYGCDEGYTLQGESVRTCQVNGIWSGRGPVCNQIITMTTIAPSPSTSAAMNDTTGITPSKVTPGYTDTRPSAATTATTAYTSDLPLVTGEVCSGVADVFFIMDSSGSVGSYNWQIMISFMGTFVRTLNANIDGVRIGVVRFGSGANLEFSLNKYNTTEEIIKAIDNLRFIQESTNLAAGFEVTRTEGFTLIGGDRPEAANIAIMITDGQPIERVEDTEPQAQMLKDAGVTLIMVGVTDNIDHDLLVRIASQGEDDVISVEDFDALKLKLQDLIDIVCISRRPPTTSHECNTAKDVVLLIDASTSESKKWEMMRSFVSSILQSFNISEEAVHVAIVIFSRDAQVIFSLNDQQDKESVLKLIADTSSKEGITNIAGALEVMQTKVFVDQNGDRLWAPNICVLVTDGQSIIQGNEHVVLAEMAKNSGITMVTVGITEKVNLEELREMASRPELAVHVDNFNELHNAAPQIRSFICDSIITQEGSVCMKQLDVGLIIDTSGSIRENYDNWPTVLDFLKDLVNRLYVSPERVRVGAVIFSEVARLMFGFSRYPYNREVMVGLERLLFLGGATNLASGLQLANNALFTGPGARSGLPRVAVILTDGNPNVNTNMTLPQARMLQNNGVTIIAVGIGDQVDQQLLNTITNNRVIMTTFENMKNKSEHLVDLICTQQSQSNGFTAPQSQPQPYCEDQSCVASEMCPEVQADNQVRVCQCKNQMQAKICYSTRPHQDEVYTAQEAVYCYQKYGYDASKQGSPQIITLCPHFGPLMGGTEVNMWGSNLNLNSIYFSFGQVPCIIKYNNFTYAHCTTSNGIDLASPGVPQDLNIDIMIQSTTKRFIVEDAFTLLTDPVITDIYPLKSFLAGGINITVTGTNMDSVARCLLEVTINYLYLNEQDFYTSICNTVNSSMLFCRMPEITLKPGYDDLQQYLDTQIIQSRKRRAVPSDPITECQGSTNRTVEAIISINMDGYKKSECYTFHANPIIYEFTEPNMNKMYLPHWPTNDDHIVIRGEKLDLGPQLMDYTVYIGNEKCYVTELFSDSLVCIPPPQQPSHTGLHFQGAPAVKVHVGNIERFVGYLQYATPWSDQTFLIIFIIIICVGLPLLTTIIVCIGVRLAKHKPILPLSSEKAAPEKDFIHEDDYLRSNQPNNDQE